MKLRLLLCLRVTALVSDPLTVPSSVLAQSRVSSGEGVELLYETTLNHYDHHLRLIKEIQCLLGFPVT